MEKTYAQKEKELADAIARFPAQFGLRAYPGEVFCVSRSGSYHSGGPNQDTVMLYTARKVGNDWLDFAKGTESELRAQMVELPATKESLADEVLAELGRNAHKG